MLELIVLGAFSAALLLCAALGISVLYALIFGYILFAGYAFKKHYTAAEIAQMSLQGINTVKNILIVFMLIGMLTAVWRAAGTIPLRHVFCGADCTFCILSCRVFIKLPCFSFDRDCIWDGSHQRRNMYGYGRRGGDESRLHRRGHIIRNIFWRSVFPDVHQRPVSQ